MNHVGRFVRRAVSLVIVAAGLFAPGIALGQGTSGSFPGPIDSQQLDRYADRLTLSASQRLALNTAHDDYREQFRRLRDAEIAVFLQEQSGVQGGIPKRDVVQDLVERLEQINAKIALLDNGLFDRLLPMLADEQQAVVPRLRLARERRRYEVQQTAAAFGRRTVDLSALFRDLDLTPEDFAVADATIAGYERRMTTIMRKQNKAILRMTLDVMDMLAERGYVDLSQEQLIADPALVQEVVAQMGEIYAELRGKVARYTDELRTLNDRTYRQVAASVPPDQGRRLRNAFYRGAYQSLAAVVARSENDWMTRALALDDLTPEERAVLEPAAAAYQSRIEQLIAEGVRTADAFWDGFSPFDVNAERVEAFRADVTSLQERATRATEEAEAALAEQLGPDAMADVRSRLGRVAAAGATALAEPDPGADAEASEAEAFAFAGDQFLPERITRADIRRYAKQLQLAEGMEDVLDALYTDYLERVAGLDVLDRLREARGAAEDDDAETPAPDRIDRVFSLRRQALEAMASADATFFEDLAAIIGADRRALLDRVRGSRLRVTWSGRASGRFALGRDRSNEAGVDLVTIVLEERPTMEELERLDDVLSAYEAQATEAFRARLDAQLEMQKLTDRWAAEIETASREDIAAVVTLQTRYREVMRGPTERVTRTSAAIAELNRSTLAPILAALPPERSHAIRLAYDRAAFPSVYEDPTNVSRQLAAALEVEDLTAEQRSVLVDLGGMYRTEYARLSRAMVAHLPLTATNVVGLDPEAFRAWQEQQQQLARIRFDRNELNGRAISRLTAVLSAEQIQRIGGLPEPSGEDDFYFYR